jgi:hypothetical protein
MPLSFTVSTRTTIGVLLILAGGLMSGVPAAAASDRMPIAQQNALVQKYCAACHDDARTVGGLSLEHFDAAHVSPGVAAMLLSKLTNGLTLDRVKAADTDPEAGALIDAGLKSSAIYAAGLAVPDNATSRSWISALSAAADGAIGWTMDAPADNRVVTASIVREVPSTINSARADIYRLTLTCRADGRQGDMQLTWAPGDLQNGRDVVAEIDGKPLASYKVETKEWMGTNGHPTRGIGAMVLSSTQGSPESPALTAIPLRMLTVSNLLREQMVAFPFDGLTQAARQTLSACFGSVSAGQ